jgi:Zn-dependent protease with chaperone function
MGPNTASGADVVAPGAQFAAWSGTDRESFLAAVARHRRAAWRVTLASAVADVLFALVVAILMSPLFYAVIALAFDVVNLMHPAPNIVTLIGQVLRPVFHHGEQGVPVGTWIRVAFLAALPGLIWMALLLPMLRRVVRLASMFSGGELPAREPNPQVLAEQRFANVVQEMALAANLPAPRVLVADDPRLNAAAFGRDDHHATVMISQGLLERLDRNQLQGVAAHLVGSIANGDMAIGLRAATTLSLFAFLARFSGILSEPERARMILRTCVAMLHPTSARARQLTAELMALSQENKTESRDRVSAPPTAGEARNWRDWVWLPLAGPVVITGFLSSIVQMLILSPLVALAWRQRKYMADATAVRLTRDPDTLAGALQVLDHADSGAAFASWAAHLAVVAGGAKRSLMGGSLVPMQPSVGRRLSALQRMGAHTHYTAQHLPLWLWLILAPLGALLGGLMGVAAFLLAYVSLPLSALFLGIPFAVLHALLRWHSA